VSLEANYLSCSPMVKSEIVVPVFGENGEIIGELDIDSHQKKSFTAADRIFLERVCELASLPVDALRGEKMR